MPNTEATFKLNPDILKSFSKTSIPFPSSNNSHFQNEAEYKGKTFLVKMSLIMRKKNVFIQKTEKKKQAIQKFEKTLNNTQTTKQKRSNNGFHNTKKYLCCFKYVKVFLAFRWIKLFKVN